MIEIENNVIKKFKYQYENDTYYIYAIKENDRIEYYLQNKDYGVIDLMFGIEDNNIDLINTSEEEYSLLESNIKEYIGCYKESYMEDIYYIR